MSIRTLSETTLVRTLAPARARAESTRVFSIRSAFPRKENRLERARVRALAERRALLDLTESNPTRAELPPASRALAALAHPDAANYRPEPFGLRSAREAVSVLMAEQGLHVEPERVVLTASTSEAYAFLFKLLCDPGDDVLVPLPSYPLFAQLAQLEAIGTRPYPLHYDGRWHLPADALARARGPRTRAAITLHPNNPTGSYLKRDELEQLARAGLPIISDEVFASYALGADPSRARSALEIAGPLVFSLHGLSKLVGLPQLKLSFMCIGGQDAAVAEALARMELIADAFLSVATPVQLALPEILAAREELAAPIHARLRANLDRVRAAAAGTPATLLHVEGGWYAVLRLPGVLDDEEWAIELLEHAGVLVQPGYFYDFETGPCMVLSLLTPEARFEQGCERLLERVARVVSAR